MDFEELKKKIGKRISTERKNAQLTQGEFAQKLTLSAESRQTISKWESGHVLPDLEILKKMCDVFDCELGYLLCEYDCKTHIATDIQKEIGLSENAISILRTLNNAFYPSPSEFTNVLDKIICNPNFEKLLKATLTYIFDFNDKNFHIDNNAIDICASNFNCQKTEVTEYFKVSSESLLKETFLEIVSEISLSANNKYKRKKTNNSKKLSVLE